MNMQRGPLGQPRGLGFGILMVIVTLGIYAIYWSYVTFEEMKLHRNGQGIGGALGLIIYIIFSPAIYFLAPSEIGQMYAEAGKEKPVQGTTGLWILLPIAGAFIWWFKIQGALNRYWESMGAGATAPAETAPAS